MTVLAELEELVKIEVRTQASPVERQILEGHNRVLRELHHLRREVRTMSQTQQDQDTQITAAVTALSDAFTGFETAVATEIANIKSSPAAADPVVAQALANIEALTAKIVADTTAALPA